MPAQRDLCDFCGRRLRAERAWLGGTHAPLGGLWGHPCPTRRTLLSAAPNPCLATALVAQSEGINVRVVTEW